MAESEVANSPTTSKEWRIDEFAHETGVPSATIRFYQQRGLLPPPRKQGRVGYYGEDHKRTLERLRELQADGLPLELIKRVLDREGVDSASGGWSDLGTALAQADEPAAALDESDLKRIGFSASQLRKLEASGFLQSRDDGGLLVPQRIAGTLEQFVAMGVSPQTISRQAEEIAARLRVAVEPFVEVGREVVAGEVERLRAGEDVGHELARKLEFLKAQAPQIILVLSQSLLAEAARAEAEAAFAQVGREEDTSA